jgi:dienelactone hydrolase
MRHAPRALALVAALWLSVGLSLPRVQAEQAPTLRQEFRAMIVGDRKPCELKPQLVTSSNTDKVRIEKVRLTLDAGQDAVAMIQRPKEGGPFPVVIVQHFLGASKDHFLIQGMVNSLAQRGLLAVAIDGRYRGDRQNGKSLQAAMAEALKTGKERPWLVDTTYDIIRLLDYLETREDVDPKRIGMAGVSEGGIITWMSAAADDRIRVVAPIIGVTTFADALVLDEGPDTAAKLKLFDEVVPALRAYAQDIGEPGLNTKVLRSAWEKLVPGSLDKFDAPKLVPEIAPRPLFIQNNEADEIFSIAGARKVAEATRARYEQLKAADKFEFKVSPGKHSDVGAALAAAANLGPWIERNLKAAN